MDIPTEKPYTIPVYPDDPDRLRMMVTDSKLGGYIVGGDENTAVPKLWDYLIDELGVGSVIDIGCGEGHALDHFRARSCVVHGVEAIPQPKPFIFRHDFREGPYKSRGLWDLAWSCEFVEHVDERFVPNFMETFMEANRCLITHATPGQGGFNHVNEQPAGYWVRWFDRYGFELDVELTENTRAVADAEKWSYYGHSGMAFRRA